MFSAIVLLNIPRTYAVKSLAADTQDKLAQLRWYATDVLTRQRYRNDMLHKLTSIETSLDILINLEARKDLFLTKKT